MIRSEKFVQAMEALQQVIIRARFLAAKENQAAKVIGLLDAAEELPRLLADEADRTEEFAVALREISQRYPYCRNIFENFNHEISEATLKPAQELQFV